MQHVLFSPQLCFHTLMHYWKHIHFCPIIFLIILLYLAVLFWERKALFACFGHVGRHEQINKTWWERVGKSHLCLSFRKYHCYIIPPQILYWGTMACTHLSWLGGCRPIATSAMALQPCLTVYGGTFYVLERNNARNKRENSLSWVKGVFFVVGYFGSTAGHLLALTWCIQQILVVL